MCWLLLGKATKLGEPGPGWWQCKVLISYGAGGSPAIRCLLVLVGSSPSPVVGGPVWSTWVAEGHRRLLGGFLAGARCLVVGRWWSVSLLDCENALLVHREGT